MPSNPLTVLLKHIALVFSFGFCFIVLSAAVHAQPETSTVDTTMPETDKLKKMDEALAKQAAEQAAMDAALDAAERSSEKPAPANANAVEINGDKVEYIIEENKVVAEGNVIITKGETTLYADKIDFFRETKTGIAEGNILLESPQTTITADKMTYNFETETGHFDNARFISDPYIGKGKTMAKLGANHMDMKNGYLTTCDHDVPHYSIRSKVIDVFPGEKAVARHVRLQLGPVPVFYLPKFKQSLKERRPRVQLTPGKDKEWGVFLLQTWRYEVSPNLKAKLHLDYREKRDFASGLDFDYKTPATGNGIVKTYYMNERTLEDHPWKEQEVPTTERERFRFDWRHKWRMDEQTDAIWQFNRMSDAGFLKDYFEKESFYDLNPPTYFLLNRGMEKGLLSFRADARVNRFYDAVERLPEVRYEIATEEIGDTNVYIDTKSTYSNLVKKPAAPSDTSERAHRFDTNNELSYPTKVGFVEFRPFVGDKVTYYSRTPNFHRDNAIRNSFRTGSDLSTRFYRLFEAQSDNEFMPINRLRHVIGPNVNYLYRHDPSLFDHEVYQFDELDEASRTHLVSLSLTNKLQTKRNGEPWDLIRMVVGSPFYLKEDPTPGGFGNVTSELEIIPNDRIMLAFDNEYSPETDRFVTNNIDLYLQDNKSWRYSIGRRFTADFDDEIRHELSWAVNPKWRLRVYQDFSTDIGVLQEQEYSITRDLHEWEATLNWNETRGEGSEIWMIFTLKAFPDMPIDLGTSFNRRKLGSQSSEGEF